MSNLVSEKVIVYQNAEQAEDSGKKAGTYANDARSYAVNAANEVTKATDSAAEAKINAGNAKGDADRARWRFNTRGDVSAFTNKEGITYA